MAKDDVIELEGKVFEAFQMQCLKLSWKTVMLFFLISQEK